MINSNVGNVNIWLDEFYYGKNSFEIPHEISWFLKVFDSKKKKKNWCNRVYFIVQSDNLYTVIYLKNVL